MMLDCLQRLSSLEPGIRRLALREAVQAGGFPPASEQVNMHLHSFFSYNGEGWSPTRIAYEMKRLGLYSAALCDFDVLHGLPEFFEAADMLQLRAAVAFESRVFFQEYAQQEINSPGEPGVFYFMGMGFVEQPAADSQAGQMFAELLLQSHQRNRELIGRINSRLAPLALDYENDVLPLTPANNATERHITLAFHQLALRHFADKGQCLEFWSRKLDSPLEQLEKLFDNTNAFLELLRGKLMKRGGLGYVQPSAKAFPKLELVIDMIRQCRAIPMSAWLDGSLPGEQNPEEQLQCLLDKKVEALNIIPDRNWNFKDPELQRQRVAALDRYVAAAAELELPINVGTEGNKPGQRLVDDFEAEALRKHRQAFLQGAQIMVGHTRLLRYADLAYIDDKAQKMYPQRARRNEFFAKAGALPAPGPETRLKLGKMSADNALDYISEAAVKQAW